MPRSRSILSLCLCIALFASLFSGVAASAAPLKPSRLACRLGKLAALTVEKSAEAPAVGCCIVPEKIAAASPEVKLTSGPTVIDPCCEILTKLSVRGKVQIGGNQGADPCAPAPVDTSCGITYPVGAVVGNMPFNQQAYYDPGLLANGVIINAGTYWVTGLGEADNGDKFYQIVVACQFLFVPENDIVPSYQAPWSGQPLPTTDPIS